MSNKSILALGADIKSRPLMAQGKKLYYGPEVGDLSDAQNFKLFEKGVVGLIKRVGRKPDIIASDLHPGYFSTRFGRELSDQLPKVEYRLIQHHHAHIGSVLAEADINKPVIGVSFDGTGFGSDGNFWGGEFLLVKRSGFRRLAHLKYRMMPGSDKVVYEPWRMDLSIVGREAKGFIKGVARSDEELLLSMMDKRINSPLTSSAGRLFDGAAALIGICRFASYEAEGPMKLEKICDNSIRGFYGKKVSLTSDNGCYIIDTDAIFSGIIKDLKKGKPKEFIATRFHNSIAEIISETCIRLSNENKIKTIALSGGVFQNRFLTDRVIVKLSDSGFKVLINKDRAVNDLNISLGQYYVSCNTCKG